jgi:S-adenosylmethionine hydrolase
LITWPWRRFPDGGACFELVWRPDPAASATFQGRDIMAPVAGRLAADTPIAQLAVPNADPLLLDVAPSDGPRGRIVHVDHFGNLTTNILSAALKAFSGHVIAGRRDLGPLRRTYHDVKPGQALALIGSADLLEIAVCEGSAREQLNLTVGDEVVLQ